MTGSTQRSLSTSPDRQAHYKAATSHAYLDKLQDKEQSSQQFDGRGLALQAGLPSRLHRGEVDLKPRQPKAKLLVLETPVCVFVHCQTNSRPSTSGSISCRSGP